MNQLRYSGEDGDNVQERHGRRVDLVEAKEVLVLDEISKGGADGHVSDGIESEELCLFGQVKGLGVGAGGKIVVHEEIDETDNLTIKSSFEIGTLIFFTRELQESKEGSSCQPSLRIHHCDEVSDVFSSDVPLAPFEPSWPCAWPRLSGKRHCECPEPGVRSCKSLLWYRDFSQQTCDGLRRGRQR